jgi:protein-tyrosine phosphatase
MNSTEMERPTACTNGRDLGRLRTDDDLVLRSGLLYRSDDTGWTGRAPNPDLPAPAATAFDLRRDNEVAERGLPSFVGPETAVVRDVVIPPGESPTSGGIESDEAFAAFYVRVFDARRELLGGILRRLGSAELPAVVYCVAGKDRTGLVVAALAGVLGVRRGDIVRDYARSERFMACLRAAGRLTERDVQGIVLPLHSARAVTMEAFLTEVHARYGEGERLAGALGLDAAEVRRLRERFLEPAPEAADASRSPVP